MIYDFFRKVGFVDWAQERADDWIFAALHEHPDPSKYASKEMNKLLRQSGAIGANIEVFHSLRGDAIDDIRNTNIKDRSRRLQTGHELGDVHDLYGFRALGAAETQQLARRPLAGGIDWTPNPTARSLPAPTGDGIRQSPVIPSWRFTARGTPTRSS